MEYVLFIFAFFILICTFHGKFKTSWKGNLKSTLMTVVVMQLQSYLLLLCYYVKVDYPEVLLTTLIQTGTS